MRKKIIAAVLIMIFATALGSGYYIYSIFGKIEREKLPQNDLELGITEQPPLEKINAQKKDNLQEKTAEPDALKKTEELKPPKASEKKANPEKAPTETKKAQNVSVKQQFYNSSGSGKYNNKSVINIALFGIDSRDASQASPSDSIIIVSIDRKHEKIKVTSVMRDLYVSIPGKGLKKINTAYVHGGSLLAVKTLNTNFGTDIRNFVSINFFGLEKLIDRVGGIRVSVKDSEVREVNKYIREVSSIMKDKTPPLLSHGGTQHLNGRQAVAYARIRNVGNGDFDRTQRQRIVIDEIFKRIKAQGVAKLPGTISTMLPYVKTSLKNSDILELSRDVIGYRVEGIEEFRLPVDGYFKQTSVNGAYVIKANMEVNRRKLREFIYSP